MTAITQLNGGTEPASIADGDKFPVTDVSDTTEAAAGTTKPVAASKIKSYVNTDPVLTGAPTITASAMGANAIDVTELRNTKTLSADTTFTFSGVPGEGQEFGIEITGHTAAVTVTIPSSRRIDTNEDITTFVMPANGYAVLTWRRKGSVNLLAGVPGLKLAIPFAIETVADGDYPIFVNLPWAGKVDSITTDSASGTCTLTGKVNTTALGGTANSVSTTETTQAHTTTNTFVATDRLVVTASANSACTRLVGTIVVTVF